MPGNKPCPITMDAVYAAPGCLFRRMQQIAVALFVEECKAYDLTPVQYAAMVAIHTHPGIDATRLSAVIALRSLDARQRDRAAANQIADRAQAVRPRTSASEAASISPNRALRCFATSSPRSNGRRRGCCSRWTGKPEKKLLALPDVPGRSQQRGFPSAAARRGSVRTYGKIELMAAADVRPVLIAGGGIGGLAAALGLAQKGIRSILLEKATAALARSARQHPAPGPIAFHLRLSGRRRSRARHGRLHRPASADGRADRRGDHPCRSARGVSYRFGNPYAVVHRGDLHGVFLRALRRRQRTDRSAGEQRGHRLRSGRLVGDGAARQQGTCHGPGS